MSHSALLVRQAAAEGITRLAAGVALFDAKGRLLLLRCAGGGAMAGLWELPSGAVQDGETPDQAALRELGVKTGIHDVELRGYEGFFDCTTTGGTTRQFVFSAHVDGADVALSLGHDACTWRYADALPAVSSEVLALVRAIAPPKPQLDPDEWQHTLPGGMSEPTRLSATTAGAS